MNGEYFQILFPHNFTTQSPVDLTKFVASQKKEFISASVLFVLVANLKNVSLVHMVLIRDRVSTSTKLTSPP